MIIKLLFFIIFVFLNKLILLKYYNKKYNNINFQK